MNTHLHYKTLSHTQKITLSIVKRPRVLEFQFTKN